jgi:hypothetical protein
MVTTAPTQPESARPTLIEQYDKLIERSVGAMTIAQGDRGWRKIPLDCPMLEAVGKLRAEYERITSDSSIDAQPTHKVGCSWGRHGAGCNCGLFDPDKLPADARRDDLVLEIAAELSNAVPNDLSDWPYPLLVKCRDAIVSARADADGYRKQCVRLADERDTLLARSTGASARIVELEKLLTRMDNEHAEHHYFTCPAENDMPCDCPIGPLHDAARSALKVRK